MMTVEVGITQPSESLGLIHGFPVVGIGASAGGLEALKQFLRQCHGNGTRLRARPAPGSQSRKLDGGFTGQIYRHVRRASCGWIAYVSPNHVRDSRNHYLSMQDGVLHLSPPTERRGMRMPIDHFCALAEELGEKAICVIFPARAAMAPWVCAKSRGAVV